MSENHTEPAPTSGDWRERLRRSKYGSGLVLALTLALVLGGAWLLGRPSGEDEPEQAALNGATAVTLEGDQSGSAPEVGQPAPGFTATTLDGKQVSLAELKGQPVWLNFGATWCTACRAEAPDIEAAWKKHQADDVMVLSIFINEDRATIQGYTSRLGLTVPMISDPETTIASRYRSLGIPSHFFIDRDGILRKSHMGALNAEQMDENLALIKG
ncbi:TlpA family protein disulfide reductase [Luteococcus sp. Sow4_B9]|uniref:TlpA family protein disulfide reductase n=1 Tax=Luteococcus sp. Sow4_B9 TaxID=3438792 RepID=UPI003F9C9E4E